MANLKLAQTSTTLIFQQWQEMAISLGLGDRITSINDTMADTEAKYHDQLCALDVLYQWMQRRNPTVEEMFSAIEPYVSGLKRGTSAQLGKVQVQLVIIYLNVLIVFTLMS